MNKIWDENFDPPWAKIQFLGKKRGEEPQNQQKFQPSPIELKFSGKARSNKWTRLGKKILTPPLSQNPIFRQKKGGGTPKSAKISTKSDWAKIFREGQVK